MTRADEYRAVKLVGEKIGYGNLMTIASALWRRSMRDSGYPESGVFVPVCPSGVDKEYAKDVKMEQEMLNHDIELDQLIDDKKI